jgi:hypothetical protein
MIQLLVRHIVTGRQILTIAIICFSVLLIGYIIISPRRLTPQYAVLTRAEGKCEHIALFLKKYYAELDTIGEKPQVSDVVKFIENQRGRLSLGFSSQAPVAPYLSPFDFGIYLLLPEKLESDVPTLIAYTTRIKRTWKNQEQFFRMGFFLRGRIEQVKPDFYYWACKEQYLKSQEEMIKEIEQKGK